MFFADVIDTFTVVEFASRFTLQSLYFGTGINSGYPIIYSFILSPVGLFTVFFTALYLLILFSIKRIVDGIDCKKSFFLSFSFFVIFIFSCYFSVTVLAKPWGFNTSFNNINSCKIETYYEDIPITYDGVGGNKNVIILVMESLSSYKSKYFFPKNNSSEIPFIDYLAENNIAFKNYSCTGFNSTENMYSIISSFPSVYTSNENSSKDSDNDKTNVMNFSKKGQRFFMHSLTKTFKDEGYNVSIFNGANLVFGMNNVLESNFNYISTASDSYYDSVIERYVFNSVPDEFLYERVLNSIDNNSRSKFLYFIRTASTHNPFKDPLSKELSFDKTLNYADLQLKNFYQKLNSRKFFNNGIFLILGDHRAMLPLTELEKNLSDRTKVPLVIVDKFIKNKYSFSNSISHQSLSAIVQYLALDKVRQYPHQVNPFVDKTANETVVYKDFRQPNEFLVIKGKNSCILENKDCVLEYRNCSSEELNQEYDALTDFLKYLLI